MFNWKRLGWSDLPGGVFTLAGVIDTATGWSTKLGFPEMVGTAAALAGVVWVVMFSLWRIYDPPWLRQARRRLRRAGETLQLCQPKKHRMPNEDELMAVADADELVRTMLAPRHIDEYEATVRHLDAAEVGPALAGFFLRTANDLQRSDVRETYRRKMQLKTGP